MNAILILGATSDIAQSIAKVYASHNFTIMLAGRCTEKIDLVRSDLEIRHKIQVTTHFFDADQSHEEHQRFYESLPVSPTLVIYCIGYLGDQRKAQKHWAESQSIFISNYTGAISILSIVANDMEQRNKGLIVGISSVAGDRGRQSNYLYGSAKAGFSAFLSGLRNRLYKSNVHVMTVKPGFVNTKMIDGMKLPGPLIAQPDQLAGKIYRAARAKKNTIYILSIWRWVMLLIRLIPEPLFKRMNL